MSWLEISADYRCNCHCLGCYSSQGDGASMGTAEVVRTLEEGRRAGRTALWLGGGEPTLRRDLCQIVAFARQAGYTRIRLQTNGMLLSYPRFAERCVAAGITEVNFSLKGATAATHERYSRTPGSHELLLRGIAGVRQHGLPMEGDILVYRGNVAEIPDIVRTYTQLGLVHFNLWLFSTSDWRDGSLGAQVPRIAQVVPQLVAAMDLGLSTRPDFITSLHTPACTVPPTHHACLFHAADLELVVANPGGHMFRLEESPMEGGTFLERCAGCRWRARCGGLRSDYLALFGDAEFVPKEA